MEERKQKEINHYNEKAEQELASSRDWQGDFEGFNPFLLSSYNFLPEYLKNKCLNKEVLDYGCGNGVHSFWLEKLGAKVTALDLSEKSLKVARIKKEKLYRGAKVDFVLGDCEDLDFNDSTFDIIFDGGSFSSLDLKKALPELVRVLKPDGFLIGIETFGHNPITNLKRHLNKILGKRTGWAASHIFSLRETKLFKDYFNSFEIYYFHIVSWAAIPFLKIPIFRPVLKLLEIADRILLTVPFLRKYSFKVVFVVKNPKKNVEKIV